MALKDLVVSHAELTEEQIEKIVSSFARYDPVAKSIVLLPPAMALSNRQRMIVYLVALRGWPFVLSDDTPPTGATPAELEQSLQMPGGTLRPILKELKDARLIENNEGRYSANPVTFPFLEEQLHDSPKPVRSARKAPQSARATASPATSLNADEERADPPVRDHDVSTQELPRAEKRPKGTGASGSGRARRDATSAGGGPLVRLRALIKQGWFDTPRSTQAIVDHLATRGAHYRGQDLTRQLQLLIRSEELVRSKKAPPGSGRAVWHYSTS